ASVLQRSDREQRDPAWRHHRRAEVHRPSLCRRLRESREPAQATVHVASVAAVLDGARCRRRSSHRGPDPAARVKGESTMCPTVLGRVQTRWAILIIPAIIWTIVSLITGNHFSSHVIPVIVYWVSWVIAVWTKVVILPLMSLSWIEDAGEFRQTGWSVAPEYLPLPVTAFTPELATGGPPPLARKFSAAVIEIPEELRRAPSPSGVFQIPTGPPPG